MPAESVAPRAYLGVPLNKLNVAFFDFTSCEGCQLQVLNSDADLPDLLALMDVKRFREAMTGGTDDYDLAFVEGSITNKDEERRLKSIRKQAATLVAFGSCACFGGVNQLRNAIPQRSRARMTSGARRDGTGPARPLHDVVPVDLNIYGCPVRKEEVETVVLNLALGKSVTSPAYPVCLECKANGNLCLFDLGEPCLGPVTRGGCNAWCPGSKAGCWGCRGPAEDANVRRMRSILCEHGIPEEAVETLFSCFGGFPRVPRTAGKPSSRRRRKVRS